MSSSDHRVFPETTRGASPAAARPSAESLGPALLDFFRDAVILSAPPCGPFDCNRAALDMFGFHTKEKLLACDIAALSPDTQPDGSPSEESAARHREKAAREGAAQYEWVHRRKDQSLFDAEVSLRVEEMGGKSVEMIAIRDVTAQKRGERALRRSEQRHRTIFDAAYDAIFLYDFRAGRVVDINQKACELCGYPREELIEKGAELFFWNTPPHTFEKGREIARKTRTEGPQVFEWRARHRSGRHFWIEVSAKRIRVDEGEYILLVMRDIDSQKKLLEALAEAKEKADMANRSKSAFLANMSHEIRTPMNAIVGITHLLSGTPLNTKQMEYLRLIENASGNLSMLINDILDFSQIDTGNIELEETDVDFESLFAHLTHLSRSAQDKNLDLLFDLAPDLPRFVRGDPVRLGQILSKLVGNAVKFTERGQIVVTADMIARRADSVSVRFRVMDSGIGIPEEQLSTIFQPFTQADNSTTRQYGGSGLGLSICRKLAEKMGGRLDARSRVGEGSTFELTVELGTNGPPSSPVRSFSGWSAAVVVADAATRQALVRTLSAHFDDVVAAKSIARASSRIDKAPSPVRVVIFDDATAALSPEAASSIFDGKMGFGHRPTLLHLASKFPNQGSRCCFADGHATKPFIPAKLIERIFKAADETRLDSLAATSASKRAEESGLQGVRVLVVEDSETNRQVAKEILSVAGVTYRSANDGKRAVDILREDKTGFDAVLMDVQMPVMDGYEATRAIRTELDLTHLPIIAMTADASLAARQACLASGMNDYISKPIRVDNLYEVLRRHTGEPKKAARSCVNFENGLERAGGKMDLYIELVEDFIGEYEHFGEQITEVLDAQDTPEAKMLTHKLKGSAGTIGADALVEVTADIDEALGHTHESAHRRVRSLLGRLTVVLDNTIRDARGLIKTLQSKRSSPSDQSCCGCAREVEKLLDELSAHIDDNSFTALETCEKLRHKLTDPKQIAAAWELTKKLKVFNYTAASRLLTTLRAHCESG